MEHWMERIEEILERAPTRAMSFTRLIVAMKDGGLAVEGREDWILKRVSELPETFRVIPDRLGPWVLWPEGRRPGVMACHLRTSVCDPWIMTCSPGSPAFAIEGKFVGRVQETLQAWGREIDDGSQVAVARWIMANMEAERAFGRSLHPLTERAEKPQSTTHPLRPPPRR